MSSTRLRNRKYRESKERSEFSKMVRAFKMFITDVTNNFNDLSQD